MREKVLQDILRKIGRGDPRFNWFQALPRVLRIHHDAVDPVRGFSPYQAVFGLDRAVGGLPWPVEKECLDASDFLEQMRELDSLIARRLNARHALVAAKLNDKRLKLPPPMRWVIGSGSSGPRWWGGGKAPNVVEGSLPNPETGGGLQLCPSASRGGAGGCPCGPTEGLRVAAFG